MSFLLALALIIGGAIIILSAKNNQSIVEYIRGLQS
jgi:hypothetical protein